MLDKVCSRAIGAIAAGPVAEKPLVTEAADEVRVGDARAKEIKWEETK